MKPIPLNALTLYADLAQNVSETTVRPEAVSLKTIKGKKFAYAVASDGNTRPQRYLGPAGDPGVKLQIEALKIASASARRRRGTVSLLKRAGLPAPTLVMGRLLEVIANAGLFERGMTLVGTAAYQTYSPIVEHVRSAANLMTNDADLSQAEFNPAAAEEDFLTVLKRADPTFEADWKSGDTLPKAFHASSNGFMVELLTKHGRGGTPPVEVKSIAAAAVPLSFQEYLSEDAITVVALYGSGIRVRVPAPARYAVHKLIIANRRDAHGAKRQKDLAHARELMSVLQTVEPMALHDALEDAKSRGPTWQKAIAQSFQRLARTA